MSIVLTPIAHGELCHGCQWSVADINVLAESVARVAMGQYRHVAQVLEGLKVNTPKGSKAHAENAKKKMQVAANGDPWQRDGWIFQVISWIAANQQKLEGTILSAPHAFHAHKGFDGMRLDVTADGVSVSAVVIFEDKATDNPRKVIREQVLPEIAQLEAGERISELTHEATALLEAHQHQFPKLNVDGAIDRIFWQEARRYRVSITADDSHKEEAKRAGLFADYDTTAKGNVNRRCAETMHFEDLRTWMDDFAALVTTKLDELANV